MRQGALSLLAIGLAIPVLYGAIVGHQSLEAAALRIVVLAIAVAVVDRYVAPLVMALVRVLGSPSSEG